MYIVTSKTCNTAVAMGFIGGTFAVCDTEGPLLVVVEVLDVAAFVLPGGTPELPPENSHLLLNVSKLMTH